MRRGAQFSLQAIALHLAALQAWSLAILPRLGECAEVSHSMLSELPCSAFKHLGCLQRPTVFRESVYTAGYLGVCPVLRESLEARGWSPGQAFAAGGVTAGMLASVLTHPAGKDFQLHIPTCC